MRILLVEDDLLLGQALETGIQQFGYTVDWVTSGESALEALDLVPFSAVALDINLPDLSGFRVLKQVRRTSKVPVVIMTARDALDDRIEGLDLGADDYIVKPFDLKELLARMRAVVRRSHGRAEARLTHRDIELDSSARTVKKAGEWVRLTGREYQILALLMERTGRILSRSDIETRIYAWDNDTESNTVEAAIYTLRKKLGRDLVTNVRGVGYVIQP
ncbi:response regulator transcription factor [Asticcacaulis sp. 201]|uniref:response regulator transcription factor n=1 Tax=Asticcacaulis sp. 201 TaxID=3028787 RepID=UPI00291627AC|nr:response regulator transcription factor [Asticcacaulis sp. 201]MDV6331195.1 response regulator transcription factor [Asticcacaulis sp. 201]